MQLAAKITVGWADIPRSQFSARELHNRAIAEPNYTKSLFHQLQLGTSDITILGVDQLFRQTTSGMRPIRQLIGELSYLPTIPVLPSPLPCEIDLFAYAFLAGAKNFDLLLPLTGNNIEIAHIRTDCNSALQALENFERTGTLPHNLDELDAQQYLAIRRIISRPSARDELRTLATLLVSGPSTAPDLVRELGINESLAQRMLGLFESIGIFTRWGEEPDSQRREPVFVINKVAIPLVIFCLRETLGLDLLSNLSALMDAHYG
ncbi:MAG: hypothetical protein AAFV46_16330, partial [Cyanobacteria bacterium J06635_11]